MEKPSKKDAVAIIDKTNNALATKTSLHFDTIEAIEVLAQKLSKSKFCKLDNTEDVFAVIMIGREAGLTPMQSVMMGNALKNSSILAIQTGKALGLDASMSMRKIYTINTPNGEIVSAGADVINAVLLKNGITYKILDDYVPNYVYRDYDKLVEASEILAKDKSAKVVIPQYTIDDVYKSPENFQILNNKDDEKLPNKVHVVKYELPTPANCPINYITRIEFYRKSNGMKLLHTLTMYDIIQSGVFKVGGLWDKYPKSQLRLRNIAIMGRVIAADFLQGVYSNNELIEVAHNNGIKVEYDTDEEGTVTTIHIPNKE